MIQATLFSDPACPWAYSGAPALRVLEWRYGEQLSWRLVLIGLTEDASQYAARGYTPLRGALGQALFRRRYGMPFAAAPKQRLSATARACRAVIAARIDRPGSEWRVFRALQLANFTTPTILDDDADLLTALRSLPEIDAEAIVGRIDAPDVVEAYGHDKEESRQAAGSAAELQGKTRVTDGPVRFTAPSVVFQSDGLRLVAGGFQPVEAYDILAARPRARVLTFGAGIHYCLGANLARAEMEEAVAFLAERVEEIHIEGAPELGTPSGIYGVDRLELTLRRAAT